MKVFTYSLITTLGLLLGFVSTLYFLKERDLSWEAGNIYLEYADQTLANWPFNFQDNWQIKPDHSRWIADGDGLLEVYLPNRPRSKLILNIQAKLEKKAGADFDQSAVLVNEEKLGVLYWVNSAQYK